VAGLPLRIIVGLGNPGDEYARTRHNAGFWFTDELARRHGGAFRFEPRHQADVARVRIGAADLFLVKPQTYMNLSGTAVGSVAHFYKVAPDEILVAYDELDLEPGVVRLKHNGGAAGHNGVRDVAAAIGDSFWRFRFGIGRPGTGGSGIDKVLGRPSSEEEKLLRETILAAADAVPVLIEQGAQIVMNQLHSRETAAAATPVPPAGPAAK